MSVSAYVAVTADRSQVGAGERAVLTVYVTNTGGQAEEYSLRPRGVEPAWLTLRPPTIAVGPGERATASIVVAVPTDAFSADLLATVAIVSRRMGTPIGEASVPLRILGSAPPPAATGARPSAPAAGGGARWPFAVAGIAGIGVLLVGVVAFLVLHNRGGEDTPAMPAGNACAAPTSKIASLFSDDALTAIRLSNPDLSDLRVLRTERADVLPGLYEPLLSLSGDNSRLAYVTAANEAMDDAHLWSIDVANPGQRVELASIPRGFWSVRPAWSPDDRQVAYIQLNPQKAAQNQTQLELWIAEVGGQAHKVDTPPDLLQPEDFSRNPALPLCWAADNKTVIFQNIVRQGSAQDQGTRAASAPSNATTSGARTAGAGGGTATAARDANAGGLRQTEIDVANGSIHAAARATQVPPPSAADVAPPPPPPSGTACAMPVFSQNDPSWRNILMYAAGDSIGNFGCAVTSTAMVLNYYGAALTPPQLNQCLGQAADLLYWAQAVPCAKGAVTGSNGFDFSWPNLDQVLNAGKPAIVGMIRGQTGMHFVVVTAGGGGSASNYAVSDPWDATTNKSLQTFINSGYNLRWIRTYDGKDQGCKRVNTALAPAGNEQGVSGGDGARPLAPSQLMPFFTKAAERTAVPREVLLAIARIESNFTPRAQGPLIDRFAGTEDAHALGMMQFLPSTYRGLIGDVDAATGKTLGKEGIWDPESAIFAAAFYLRNAGAPGDLHRAIFAYNNAEWYVTQVLDLAKKYAGGVVLDDNIFDPNGSNKPGTRADPNPIGPLGLPTGAPSGTSTAPGSPVATTPGTTSTLATVTPRPRASGTAGAPTTGGGKPFPRPQWLWSIPDGSVSDGPVVLNVSWIGDIGDVLSARLLTLTLSGGGAGPVPVRDFTPGMTVSAEGVYQAMIVTQLAGHIEVTSRKFTIDRTAPTLDISLANAASPAAARGGPARYGVVAPLLAPDTKPQSRGPAKVAIRYEDRLSGVAIIESQLDGGDWQPYFGDVNFKASKVVDVPGDHRIAFRATDLAGNISAIQTLDFTVLPANAPATPTPRPATATPAPSASAPAALVATAAPPPTETPTPAPESPTQPPAPVPTPVPTPIPGAPPPAPVAPDPNAAPATDTPQPEPTATVVPTPTVEPTAIRGPASLKLPGNIVAEATSADGAAVTFAVTATDNAAVSCTPASGAVFKFGTTTVNCTARDASGNITSGSFTVTVRDTQPPALKLPGDLTVEANTRGGATVTYAVSASDAVDGETPVRCTPASGTTFKVGTATVSCTARDAAGNVANGGFRVIVRDTQAPALTLPGDIAVEATSAAGAVATYTVSASDVVDGTVPVTCAPASGTAFKMGTTPVTCTARDAAGNVQTGTFRVTVRDTTPPVISVPAPIRVQDNDGVPVPVRYQVSATDNITGPVPVSCTPPSGSLFPVQKTTVTCTARDAAGNVGTASFPVDVFVPSFL